MLLQIPIAVTTLGLYQPVPTTKLTREAVEDLVTLVEADEVLCLSSPKTSGQDCTNSSARPSQMS